MKGVPVTPFLASLGIWSSMRLRHDQVRSLSDDDIQELREDGASDDMIARLRFIAYDKSDTRDVRLDFHARTVSRLEH